MIRLPPEKKEGDEEKNLPDWGEAYTTLLAHTGMSYEEIGRRTIPQLEAILAHLGKHIELKLGVRWGGGVPAGTGASVEPEEEHSIDEGIAFCAMFGGIE